MPVAASTLPPSISFHLLVIPLLRYAGSVRSSLGWHQDTQSVVTVLLMPSDPRDYSGGRLQHQCRATGDVDEGENDEDEDNEDEEGNDEEDAYGDEEEAAGAPQEALLVETAALGLGGATVYRSHHLHQVSPPPLQRCFMQRRPTQRRRRAHNDAQ